MTDGTELPTLAKPDDDPWIWLEDVEGERATAWVDERTADTVRRFGGPRRDADAAVLAALLDRPDKIPGVTRRGDHLYNVWQDAANPRGLWRRTTLDSYRRPEPEWDVLLDLDALARREGEDWVWAGSSVEPTRRERAILRLSRGGSDAVVLSEFDLPSRSFVADGFTAAEAKAGIDWLDPDTLLLSSAAGEGMATRSGYARTVRRWARGQTVDEAEPVFAVAEGSMAGWGVVDRSVSPPRAVYMDRLAFFDSVGWLGDATGPKRRLELPTDADWFVHGDTLLVKPRTPWTVAGRTHAPDELVAAPLSAFLSGARDLAVLFEPGPRRSLEGFFWAGGALVLSVLDDLVPRFTLLTPDGAGWRRRELDALPSTGVVGLRALDAEPEDGDGTLVVSAEDPVTPPRTLLFSASGDGAFPVPALLKASPAGFDAAGLVVTRHEAVSVDGERIPYTQTGPAGETGDAPVHLSGYGGFAVSTMPHYRLAAGKLWLERGGTTVTANIRGGGEFGTRWHEAGRRDGKRLAHDDFAAVAADLVRRGVTRPGRIAAEGGSNGGLLIANMLTRYPERFGALFCTIPLIDMRRYSKLLAGASWIAEYGDPDVPEDWAFLGPMSAYHAAEPGRPYPPTLIATTRRDDRVHPGHARKMAAKLQAMGYPAWLYEPAAGGHGYGKDNAERAAFVALGYGFLRRAIGWDA
ncbi:prolyl oligopeptidase family serine peptidase [Lichenibacterium dinghuense]|uniref:prolyl oligopeptidase family serine peptidase n=1 Tax=Lichenibacterium dinghuense TaxID=2895977 RepID=UPI001EFF951A|nr:prolyl oligopeptidase family serine peptidase [Lichenibacterium sp. 6Y81]